MNMSSDNLKQQLDDFLCNQSPIDPQFFISPKSKFCDEVWDFTNTNKVRFNSVPDARLNIVWSEYAIKVEDDARDSHLSSYIPSQMIYELKVLAFFYINYTSLFARSGSKKLKPQTVVVTIRTLVRFFSEIFESKLLNPIFNRNEYFNSISHITLDDLKSNIIQGNRHDGSVLKKGLRDLANPVLAKYFIERSLQWNAYDLETIEFRYAKNKSNPNRVFPNDLFKLISNAACTDISIFLNLLSIKPEDKTLKAYRNELYPEHLDGSQMFEDYVAIREQDRNDYKRIGKKSVQTQVLRNKFKQHYDITVQQFFDLVYRVQRAAYTIIGLYTGARYSDLTSFTNDCVINHHGIYMLKGTVTKHRGINSEEDIDYWPAIPIMRDAITCLTKISRITFNPYLISARETVAIDAKPYPLSLNGMTGAINNYLIEIDKSKRWGHWHITAHQLRHTLAYQLARADVGLVFIAYQMKHLHTALNALPPDITMNYGNIGDLVQQKAINAGMAHYEAAKELFSPDSPVAGGGATEFKERRKMYFEGMAANGWTEDELIEHLAKQGLPYASVGFGYCGGKREIILKDGTKELPPCLGSLQCNTVECPQALITNSHKSQWIKIYRQNTDLANDERMSHAKDVLLAAADVAYGVIQQLQIDEKTNG